MQTVFIVKLLVPNSSNSGFSSPDVQFELNDSEKDTVPYSTEGNIVISNTFDSLYSRHTFMI